MQHAEPAAWEALGPQPLLCSREVGPMLPFLLRTYFRVQSQFVEFGHNFQYTYYRYIQKQLIRPSLTLRCVFLICWCFVAFCCGFPSCHHIAILTCKWGAPELAACRAAVLAAEDAGTHRGAPAVAALRGVARGALCGEGRGVKLWGEFVSWQRCVRVLLYWMNLIYSLSFSLLHVSLLFPCNMFIILCYSCICDSIAFHLFQTARCRDVRQKAGATNHLAQLEPGKGRLLSVSAQHIWKTLSGRAYVQSLNDAARKSY